MNGNPRGYCAIGIYRSKTPPNVGTLWRSAQMIDGAGCSLLFTIGRRFPPESRRGGGLNACAETRQPGDTSGAVQSIPWVDFASVADLRVQMPGAEVVGVELDDLAVDLPAFAHPDRAIYLLGAEDIGIPAADRDLCDRLVRVPAGNLNVAVAGSIVLYDRAVKRRKA